MTRLKPWIMAVVGGAFSVFCPELAWAEDIAVSRDANSEVEWWMWGLLLFIVTFIMGVVAVLGGIGGGVLFVPIVSGFFPFHLDFVRGTGLLVALAGALAASPGLLKMNLASLRLAIPVGLIGSTFAIVGALIGLALPTNILQMALGATILSICVLMLMAKKSELPNVKADKLSSALRICGIYREGSTGQTINWNIHRTPTGLFLFAVIGVMAGMFGLGAGWANVPTFNLLMGAPLKISVATSKFLLSIVDTSAAWIYINKGCVIPLMVVPSLMGIMLGSFIGVRLLKVAKPASIKWMIIIILGGAGLKALHKGIFE